MTAEHNGKRRYVRFNGADGCSDVIGLIPSQGGRLLAVETKRVGGKLTENQASFLTAVNRAGGLGVCVRSPGELLTALRKEGVVP